MEDSDNSTIARNQRDKQTIIFVKSPNESNYERDDYTRKFAETNLYLPIFVSILKTKFDESQIDEIKVIIQRGPKNLGLNGVVITSSRTIDSIQLALNKIQNELLAQKANEETNSQPQEEQETQCSTWSSIPFFLIGTSTYKSLMNLNNFGNSKIFPNPKVEEINILGHHQSGSGFKLAQFIIAYFSDLEKRTPKLSGQLQSQVEPSGPNLHNTGEAEMKEKTIHLLHLTGDPRDSTLSDNLVNHNCDSKNRIKFNLLEKIVYSTEPETQPKFEPQNLFNSSKINEVAHEINQEEQNRLEKEIETELDELQKQQQQYQPESTCSNKLVNWIIFFSPNSTRIFLKNVNNLLVKIKSRFQNLQCQDPDDQIQMASSIIKHKDLNEFKFHANLLKLNWIKIGVIGPTTSNFISKNFNFNPTIVSPKPNPSSLLKSILHFDHPPVD